MLLKHWNTLNALPGGRFLFNQIVSRWVPYTGTIKPDILELKPGFSKVQMKDRRAVRNHLKSIHAVALMNLGEFASGLAFYSCLPQNARGILVSFSIDYIKKARGTLTSECMCSPISSNEKKEHVLESLIRNDQNQVVAHAKAVWLVGSKSD